MSFLNHHFPPPRRSWLIAPVGLGLALLIVAFLAGRASLAGTPVALAAQVSRPTSNSQSAAPPPAAGSRTRAPATGRHPRPTPPTSRPAPPARRPPKAPRHCGCQTPAPTVCPAPPRGTHPGRGPRRGHRGHRPPPPTTAPPARGSTPAQPRSTTTTPGF